MEGSLLVAQEIGDIAATFLTSYLYFIRPAYDRDGQIARAH